MRLNEIVNFNGSGWAYGKMSRYACEYGGPEKFVNMLHWNGYESGYQGGQASMVLPMIIVGAVSAGAALLINAAVKKENPNSKEKSQRYQRKANQRD